MATATHRTPTRGRSAPRVTALAVSEAGFTSDLPAKIRRLIDTYGVSGLAALLGVSKSQPSRWRSGKEQPSVESSRRIIDLDYVTSRLAEELTAYQAQEWFAGSDPFLNGANPAEVVRNQGARALEPAISAIEVGALL